MASEVEERNGRRCGVCFVCIHTAMQRRAVYAPGLLGTWGICTLVALLSRLPSLVPCRHLQMKIDG